MQPVIGIPSQQQTAARQRARRARQTAAGIVEVRGIASKPGWSDSRKLSQAMSEQAAGLSTAHLRIGAAVAQLGTDEH